MQTGSNPKQKPPSRHKGQPSGYWSECEQEKTVDDCFFTAKSAEYELDEPSRRRRSSTTYERTGQDSKERHLRLRRLSSRIVVSAFSVHSKADTRCLVDFASQKQLLTVFACSPKASALACSQDDKRVRIQSKNHQTDTKVSLVVFGRNDRIRTCDILLPKQARYQLRYIPM